MISVRLLYIPHTSSPGTLQTEHSYANATTLFSRWVKRYPDTSVYWLIPRRALLDQRAAFYKFEGIMDRFKFIEVDMDMNQVKEGCTLPPEVGELFDLVNGKYLFDCLFCEKPSILSQFLGAIQLWTRSRPLKVIVANFHYSLCADREARLLHALEMNQVMNATEADIYQFGSTGNCIDSWGQHLTKLRKYAAPNVVKQAIEKPKWIKMSSDIEELQKVFAGWNGIKDKTFTIQYGCSLNSLFSFERIYDVLKKYRMMDRDFRFKITTPAMNAGRVKLEPDWCDFHPKCPRRQFFDLSLGSHCFIIWANAPDGINHGGVNEMARLGVLPIFYAKSVPYPWCEKQKDYPFCFRTEMELTALLKWVKKNYTTDKVQSAIKKNQKMLDDVYAGEGSYEFKIDHVERLFKERLAENEPFSPMKEILRSLPDRITMTELVAYIKEKSDTGIDLDKLQGARPYYVGTKDDLRLALMKMGYRDVGTPEHIIFQR